MNQPQTDADVRKCVEELSECNLFAVDAMEALFAFSKAMEEGDVSTRDLSQVMGLAVEDGFDLLQIGLAMASAAVDMARDQRSSASIGG